MTTIIVSNPETFCFESVDDDFRMSSWYWGFIGGLIGVFVLYIIVLMLIDANFVHFGARSLFVTAAQFCAWAAVMVALGFNFATRVKSDGGDPTADPYELPFCGLELFPQCTVYAKKATGIYFQIFIGFSFALAVISTVAAISVFTFFKVTEPTRALKFSGGCNCSWEFLFYMTKWLGLLVLQHAPILSIFIFSPGLMLLEVIPYGSRCIQDRSVSIAYYNAIIHGAFFALVVVVFVVELLVNRFIKSPTMESNCDNTVTTTSSVEKHHATFKATWFCVMMFALAGMVMFLVHFIASARNGAYVSNIVFGAFYPILVVVVLRIVALFEAIWVHGFAYSNTTSFGRRRPSWSLEARLRCCHGTYSNINLSDALHRLDGCLDRFYCSVDTQEIEALARNELLAAISQQQQAEGTSNHSATHHTNRLSGANSDAHDDDSDNQSSSTESRLAILALTTIVGPRPGRLVDKFFNRIQLFDRLQVVLESAMHDDEASWISYYEPKLGPFLVLLSRGLQSLPLVKENPFAQQHDEFRPSEHIDVVVANGGDKYKDCSFIDVKRFNRTSDVRHWFSDHSSKQATSDRRDATGSAANDAPKREPTNGADCSENQQPQVRNPVASAPPADDQMDEDEYNYYHRRDEDEEHSGETPAERWGATPGGTATAASTTTPPQGQQPSSPPPPPAAVSSQQQLPSNSERVGKVQRSNDDGNFVAKKNDDSPPVVFRTILAGFSNYSALKDASGKNDAILIVQHKKKQRNANDGGGGQPQSSSSWASPPLQSAHSASSVLGPWRYIGDVMSRSWKEQRECDMLYFPGAAFYVDEVSTTKAPTKVWLVPAAAGWQRTLHCE